MYKTIRFEIDYVQLQKKMSNKSDRTIRGEKNEENNNRPVLPVGQGCHRLFSGLSPVSFLMGQMKDD